jgi:anti-sigma factor RsiW
MTCQSARKFLHAFADGQMSVKASCELLDHLKMCPPCSAIVEEHQAMRQAVGRYIAAAAPASEPLESAIRAKLGLPPRLIRRKAPVLAPGGSAARRYLLAAAIVLAAGVAWWGLSDKFGDRIDAGGSHRIAAGPRVDRVQPGTSAASHAAEVHFRCLARGPDHQSPLLPNRLSEVEPALRSRLGDHVAVLAPDLSKYGYQFESVNLCSVTQGDASVGGHLVYVSADHSRRLSFFSVPRRDRLTEDGDRSRRNSEVPVFYAVAHVGGADLVLCAWHKDATTYLCAAQENPQQVERMVNAVRSDLVAFAEHMMLAGIWPRH